MEIIVRVQKKFNEKKFVMKIKSFRKIEREKLLLKLLIFQMKN